MFDVLYGQFFVYSVYGKTLFMYAINGKSLCVGEKTNAANFM